MRLRISNFLAICLDVAASVLKIYAVRNFKRSFNHNTYDRL